MITREGKGQRQLTRGGEERGVELIKRGTQKNSLRIDLSNKSVRYKNIQCFFLSEK